LFSDHNLLPLLQKICEDKSSVIVFSLAQKLLDKLSAAQQQTLIE
jgi:hypothetical protein